MSGLLLQEPIELDCDRNGSFCGIDCGADGCAIDLHWFAVWTRSRQEKVVAATLASLGIANYLPLKTESRQWSDRRQSVSVPLFSGYVFVKTNLMSSEKLRVLKVPGVAGIVGNSRGPLSIPDQQLEAVRQVVERNADFTVHPLLEEGDSVRVVRGALAGVEGRLLRMNSSSRLVISVEMIHRSIAVSIAREDVEPLTDLAA
jgi:transcription termination/antitermination protein NusG